MFTADVKDDQGRSPLDLALSDNVRLGFSDDCSKASVEVALYLIHCGCGGDKERVILLCNASRYGKLDVVQKLVEQHKVDPSECVLMMKNH